MSIISIVFLVFCLALSVLRSVLAVNVIEPDTGFYAEMSGAVLAQNALFLIGIAALIVLVLCTRRGCTMRLDRFSRPLSVLLIGAAVLLGIFGSVQLWNDLLAFTQGDSSVTFFGVIARMLAIPAACAMLVIAVPLLRFGGYRHSMGASAVISLWITANAARCFTMSSTIASVSDQMLEVTALCMGGLFWLAHARITALEQFGSSPRMARLWGLLFALIAVPLCVSQICGTLLVGGAAVYMSLPEQIMLLLLGLYAALWGEAMQFHALSREQTDSVE